MTTVDFTTDTSSGQGPLATHREYALAGATDFPGCQSMRDAHCALAAGEHNPPAPATQRSISSNDAPVLASTTNFPGGQVPHVAHHRVATGDLELPAPAAVQATPTAEAPALASSPWTSSNGPLLALLADVLDDLERTRIANGNRLQQLTRTEADSDGEERGFGLTLEQPAVAQLAAMVTAIRCGEKPRKNGCCLEHDATKNLQRAVRKHPLGPWAKATVGVGEKQGARLFAAIGDPYWNTLHDRPRLVSELWAYCGLHVLPAAHCSLDSQGSGGGGSKQGDPGHRSSATHGGAAGVAPTRARGQRANWSTTAKMRAYLVAESCIKQARSPYRAIYDDGRKKYTDAVHAAPCRRCGPSGNPAATGTPLSAGHQHARALRLVMKEILRDLWAESKRIHETA